MTLFRLIVATLALAAAASLAVAQSRPVFTETRVITRAISVATNAAPTLVTTNFPGEVRGVLLIQNTNAFDVAIYGSTNASAVPVAILKPNGTYQQAWPTPALGERGARSLGSATGTVLVTEHWGN